MARFVVHNRTLRELQWPRILGALADLSRTPVGREEALALAFLDEREAIERRLGQIEEVRELHRQELSSPNHDVDDIRAIVHRLRKSAVLAGLELLSCARVIQTAARVRAFYKTHTLIAPQVSAIAERVPRLNPIAARILDMIEPSGALKDSASDALAEYRGRARSLHHQIQSRIKGMLEDPEFDEALRDGYFSVRNDRYVLPIISSFRSKVPGIVHNASGTGQTIFVEPEQIIGLGNELSIAQSLVAEEEERLYAELSTDLADYIDELDETLERLASIDVIEAAARLSDRLDATRPEIVEDGTVLLPEARHPILVLQGKNVVPNRIALAAEQRALVVSGPNAGGKTVTITSLGLAALFLRAGLPVAGGSGCRVPLMKGVGSVIGDAQDMSRDLSTFTAHLSRLAEILDQVGGGWLVLIDEIAADTDPTEGAALAVAVLERLVERHAQVAVTTHLDDVKAIAITDERFVNARMAIDPQSLRPSYVLQLGTAGMSNALEMARQSGLPEEVLSRAQQHLREGSKLSVALATLEEERLELERQHAKWREQTEALAQERVALDMERERVEQARRDAKREAFEEVERELGAARSEISQTIAQIQKSQDMRRAQKMQREIEERAEEVRDELNRTDAQSQAAEEAAQSQVKAPKSIEVGSRVRLANLGQEGEVLEVDGDEAVVAVGALRTRARLRDLAALPPKQKKVSKAPGKRDRGAAAEKVTAKELEHPESRLDLRGMRVDDAERELRQFVDLLVLKGPPTGLVVHGHGTGVLRRMVREALQATPEVKAFRPGGRHEGGDGVTVFEVA